MKFTNDIVTFSRAVHVRDVEKISERRDRYLLSYAFFWRRARNASRLNCFLPVIVYINIPLLMLSLAILTLSLLLCYYININIILLAIISCYCAIVCYRIYDRLCVTITTVVILSLAQLIIIY